MAKNKRQPYAVSEKAGHQTSAESWGTGGSFSEDARAIFDIAIQVVPLLVSLVSLARALIGLVKLPLAICAALDACSHPRRSGASGTRRSISVKSELQRHHISVDIYAK